MFLFHGDSYTWGSGLEYHYLVEHLGYNWQDCKKFLPEVERLEMLPKECHLYRESNRFSSLVGDYFNIKDIVTSFRNGGDTFNILDRLENGHCRWDEPNIGLHIIQFSAPNRNLPNEWNNREIEDVIKYQIQKINSLVSNWIGICWFPEYSDVLKSLYPDKLVTIDYENNTYESFESLTQIDGISFASSFDLDDYHFTKKGHSLIADSIIKKISEMNINFDSLKI